MNEDDAIRDLVRAIKGNEEANQALDRMIDAFDNSATFNDDFYGIRIHNRIAIERAAA